MSSDSLEFDPSELIPSVESTGSGEEYVVKAKLGWGHDESPSPRLKEDSSNGSRFSPIIVEDYPLVESFRRPITRSTRKPRSSFLVAKTGGSEVPKAKAFLSSIALPPKVKVAISYWALEFGLRIPIQPFFRKLLVNLWMAPIQLSPNFWRYVLGCYVLWQE
ncbi:hypothetical protein ACOSP7_016731 [Xanthoceras sorbifolium]